MADSTADAGADHLAQIRLELPFESLKVNGGNVVVFLSDEPADTLVLDSKVLAASSPRFKARFGSCADMMVSKTIALPDGSSLKIYTYRMIYDDGSFIISDEDKPLVFPGDHVYPPPFHASDLCQGFPHPVKYGVGARSHFHADGPRTVYQNTIKSYKILFALVYGRPVDLEELEYDAALLHLTDVIALAEYHGFLPAIATQVQTLLVNLPGFWKNISESPRFYLVIASKIRSHDIFSDALRHFIGREGSLKGLHEDESVMSSAKNCKAMLKSLDCYSSRAETVIAKLRQMLLHEYQAHTNLPKRSQGPLAYTTWLNTTNSKKTFEDKCEYLAKSAFREWLDFQLVGKTHWSHIQYARTGKTDGQVEAGSLRKACEAILAADKNHRNIDFLGQKIAHKNAGIFALAPDGLSGPSAASLINKNLKSLVNQAAYHIKLNISPGAADDYLADQWCLCNEFDGGHGRARFDEGLDYFTSMFVSEEAMPWYDLPEWEESDVSQHDLEFADREWLIEVGAIGKKD